MSIIVRVLKSQEKGKMIFDKDDDLALEFVTASANLRVHSFGIPMQSLFEAKGISGNIVRAIATTNAVIAGLIVPEYQTAGEGHRCMPVCNSTLSPANAK